LGLANIALQILAMRVISKFAPLARCRPGGAMRKLVLILIAFIAVVTFIRAFDSSGNPAAESPAGIVSESRAEF
jgi:hypothetical protein